MMARGTGLWRAGEDPGNTVPGNKTAREQGFAAALVKLLKGLKAGVLDRQPWYGETAGPDDGAGKGGTPSRLFVMMPQPWGHGRGYAEQFSARQVV